VFDITNRTSYDSIIRWCEEIKGHACDKIELFIIGNKSDLEERYYIIYGMNIQKY